MTEESLDLSVLIATRSRADTLAGTLESMSRLDTAGLSWELVIVDNGSEDRTQDVLRSYESRLPLRWGYVPESGQNRARNRLIPSLRGCTTILSDDDVVVATDWLQQWKSGVQRWADDGIFGGRITPRLPADAEPWLRSSSFPFRAQCYAEFAPRQDEGPYAGTPFGPNFAIRTAVLKQQMFREDLGPASGSYAMGGETELVGRLKAAGMRVIYLPGPHVEHVLLSDNLRLEKLLKRGENAGRGDEYRRAMSHGWGSGRLWWRARMQLPLKIMFYRLLAWLTRRASAEQHFRRQYKLHSALGRLQQDQRMLRQQREPSVAVSSGAPAKTS